MKYPRYSIADRGYDIRLMGGIHRQSRVFTLRGVPLGTFLFTAVQLASVFLEILAHIDIGEFDVKLICLATLR